MDVYRSSETKTCE